MSWDRLLSAVALLSALPVSSAFLGKLGWRHAAQQKNDTATAAGGGVRVFFVGPNKSGTSTLHQLMLARGLRACHNACEGPDGTLLFHWTRVPHDQEGLRLLSTFEAYTDDGDHAKWTFLAEGFPEARFALNTRDLLPWLASRASHIARARRRSGCKYAYGKRPDAGCPRAHSASVDNSLPRMRSWVEREAGRQDKVLHYFNSTPALRARFALVNVPRQDPADLAATLDWLLRPKLSDRMPARLVLSAADLPEPRGRGPRAAAGGRAVHLNSHNTGPSPLVDCGMRRAHTLVSLLGCAAHAGDELYAACAERARRTGSKVAALVGSDTLDAAFQVRFEADKNGTTALVDSCVLDGPPP
mmetsp:Transcript_19794/g.66559  ORF Transcript_19794/g.66559 Transcript_19794/m.66559 type:complete len:358 (-) Transcript_19794:165-1238(-)